MGTEHILLGLIHEGEVVAARALADLDITLEATREKVEKTVGRSGTDPTGSAPFTPRAKKVLDLHCERRSSSVTAPSVPSTFSSASSGKVRVSPPEFSSVWGST
jgi:ATP-dependent Clp protease ATP-binding subunit ClpA